jgi:hypothetical protein
LGKPDHFPFVIFHFPFAIETWSRDFQMTNGPCPKKYFFREDFSRKGAKRCRVSKRVFFAPLRLCVRDLLGRAYFPGKA